MNLNWTILFFSWISWYTCIFVRIHVQMRDHTFVHDTCLHACNVYTWTSYMHPHILVVENTFDLHEDYKSIRNDVTVPSCIMAPSIHKSVAIYQRQRRGMDPMSTSGTHPVFHGLLIRWHYQAERIEHIEGILPKGLYLACVSMAGRALLAGYYRCWLLHSDTIGALLIDPMRQRNIVQSGDNEDWLSTSTAFA